MVSSQVAATLTCSYFCQRSWMAVAKASNKQAVVVLLPSKASLALEKLSMIHLLMLSDHWIYCQTLVHRFSRPIPWLLVRLNTQMKFWLSYLNKKTVVLQK